MRIFRTVYKKQYKKEQILWYNDKKYGKEI